MADISFDGRNRKFDFNIYDGAVVFLSLDLIDEFFKKIERFNGSFSIITHHSDRSIDLKLIGYINDSRVNKWFAQNLLIEHEKCVGIPIGLEDRWRHNAGIIDYYSSNLTHVRIPKILYGFNVSTNPLERTMALKVISKHPFGCHVDLPARYYLKKLRKYMFVLSPPGNGVDCHRTWEAIYSGCIPIVKRSPLYSSFPMFPGLILEEWSDLCTLNQGDLIRIYNEKISEINEFKIHFNKYWSTKIDECRKLY
jgi:hypothetical protein